MSKRSNAGSNTVRALQKSAENGQSGKEPSPGRLIDPATTIYPFAAIFALCLFFIIKPEQSTSALSAIRGFLGNEMGTYYLVVGLGVLIVSLWVSFSPIGQITLGKPGEKPQYKFFTWGAMVFTCGLAADILFIPFVSGSPTRRKNISRRWDPSRTGPVPIRSFIGDSSRGAFTPCSRPALALCCT